LQNIVSFIGLFCKRDIPIYSVKSRYKCTHAYDELHVYMYLCDVLIDLEWMIYIYTSVYAEYLHTHIHAPIQIGYTHLHTHTHTRTEKERENAR